MYVGDYNCPFSIARLQTLAPCASIGPSDKHDRGTLWPVKKAGLIHLQKSKSGMFKKPRECKVSGTSAITAKYPNAGRHSKSYQPGQRILDNEFFSDLSLGQIVGGLQGQRSAHLSLATYSMWKTLR